MHAQKIFLDFMTDNTSNYKNTDAISFDLNQDGELTQYFGNDLPLVKAIEISNDDLYPTASIMKNKNTIIALVDASLWILHVQMNMIQTRKIVDLPKLLAITNDEKQVNAKCKINDLSFESAAMQNSKEYPSQNNNHHLQYHQQNENNHTTISKNQCKTKPMIINTKLSITFPHTTSRPSGVAHS